MTIVPWNHKKRYGQEQSYIIGMDWLRDCNLVEDWGCALTHAKKYCHGSYMGIDGTPGKADVIADLSSYQSTTEGLFMRHILAHNHDWRVILHNALCSFTKRMSLILYRPLAEKERVVNKKPLEIDLPRDEILETVKPYLSLLTRVQPSAHGHEVVLLLQREMPVLF